MKYYLPILVVSLAALLRFLLACPLANKDCTKMASLPEIPILNQIRLSATDIVDANFPSPHSELLLGMLIGLDRLGEVPKFSAALRNTSTIHVVVVSGFNIALVFGLVTKVLGSEYKLKNLVIAQSVTLFYALLSGFEPPVVRALVMGSAVSWGKYYGRLIDGFRTLIFAAALMVLIQPQYLLSASFQLSFAASLGLILFSKILTNMLSGKKVKAPEDLISTISAQLLVWPIISAYFGKVSMIGVLVNPLIIWTVPICTILGGILLFLGFIGPVPAKFFSLIIYPFLDAFYRAVSIFGSLKWVSVDFKITLTMIIFYYLAIITGVLFYHKVVKSKHESKES